MSEKGGFRKAVLAASALLGLTADTSVETRVARASVSTEESGVAGREQRENVIRVWENYCEAHSDICRLNPGEWFTQTFTVGKVPDTYDLIIRLNRDVPARMTPAEYSQSPMPKWAGRSADVQAEGPHSRSYPFAYIKADGTVHLDPPDIAAPPQEPLDLNQ